MAITDGLEAYWKLESDGTDSSGNSETLSTAGAPTYTTGKLGNALVTSSGKYLYKDVAGGAVLSFAQIAAGFSITSWVYRTGATTADGFGTIAGYVANVSSKRRLFYFGSQQTTEYLIIQIGDGSWDLHASTTAIPLNTWTYVAVTYDGTTLKLYVDNVEVYSAAYTWGVGYADGTTGGWGIGSYRQGGGGSSPFLGRIDSQGVWNRALSTTESTDLYNAGDGLEYPFSVPTTTPVDNAIFMGMEF